MGCLNRINRSVARDVTNFEKRISANSKSLIKALNAVTLQIHLLNGFFLRKSGKNMSANTKPIMSKSNRKHDENHASLAANKLI